MSDDRELDIVVYGATGFTGRQAAAYVARAAPAGTRLGIAARNLDKLKEIAAGLGREVEIVVADGADGEALTSLARRARVVLSTAGPFARYSDRLVQACVEERADYVDITGETPWVRSLVDRFHERAKGDGVRIVPCCGFDSVPSDLGAFLVARHLRDLGQDTAIVQAAFTMSGGVNGGTLDTALTMAESGDLRKSADPLLLNPESHRTPAEAARSADRKTVEWSPEFERWLFPFVMAPTNTRVVRRSNALFDSWGEGYGPSFTYAEAMESRRRWQAVGVTLGLAAGYRALRTPFGRSVVRRLVPAPGQGPSEARMDGGFYRARLRGVAGDGRVVWAEVSDRGDPGNRATVRMVSEAALLLATLARQDLPGGPARGGVLTPATALGSPYVERLRAAGMTLTTR